MFNITRLTLAGLLLGAACLTTGCERKEKVLEIETPGTSIDVERNKDTGEVDVEVLDKD